MLEIIKNTVVMNKLVLVPGPFFLTSRQIVVFVSGLSFTSLFLSCDYIDPSVFLQLSLSPQIIVW